MMPLWNKKKTKVLNEISREEKYVFNEKWIYIIVKLVSLIYRKKKIILFDCFLLVLWHFTTTCDLLTLFLVTIHSRAHLSFGVIFNHKTVTHEHTWQYKYSHTWHDKIKTIHKTFTKIQRVPIVITHYSLDQWSIHQKHKSLYRLHKHDQWSIHHKQIT